MVKTRTIFVAQWILILLLASSIVFLLQQKEAAQTVGSNSSLKLISPRVSEGLLEPKSFLIVNYAPLRNDIQKYIGQTNGTLSVYMENMRSGAFIGIGERKGYPPASLNKVITSILIMKQVEDGKLSLDTPITIPDSARSSAFGTLYLTKEKELPLRILLEKMLRESDDTAFKTLDPLTENDDRSLLLSYLDYYSDESVNNTKPGEDYPSGLVTPKSIYIMFSSLYLSTVLEPESSEYILSLLTETSFDINAIAQLPQNVTVAHKFGIKYDGNEKYLHDCGIMYVDNMRVFYCVMTEGMERSVATQRIGAIVHGIYGYSTSTRSTLDEYKTLYRFD